MSDSVGYLGVSLFGLAIVTMVLIIRDALPLLSPEDQETFMIYLAARGRRGSGQAIINAWKEHTRSFPQSKKRIMVMSFAAAGILTFLSYPLCHTFVK